MKHFLETRPAARHLPVFALAAILASPLSVLADPVALATQPLTTTTASNVKPNVMFILDDSGTMAYDYLPDWADDNDPVSGNSYKNNAELFKNSGFNGLAYNPAVTYVPPVYYDTSGNLDTTKYPSYSTSTSWSTVKRDGYSVLYISNTDDLVGNASYYTFVNGEYCSTVKKTDCVAATAPTTVGSVVYDRPAGLRWCTNAALGSCQSIKDSSHKYPRYPGRSYTTPAVPAVRPTALIIFSGTTANTNPGSVINASLTAPVASIRLGTTVAKATAITIGRNKGASTVASTVATAIGTGGTIQAYRGPNSITPTCSTASTSTVCLVDTSTYTDGKSVSIGSITLVGSLTYTTVNSTGGNAGTPAGTATVPGSNVYTNIVSGTDSYAYAGTAEKASTRTDCAGTTCNYNEEMTNYANWWAYYHTRLMAMKTSVSRAFKTLNQNYRVGFSTICNKDANDGDNFLGNDTFENVSTSDHHKTDWFDKLFAAGKSCWTPLRGALSKTGQYYAHKVGTVDPVQYSCQQNFAILSTDGYWNTDVETTTFGPFAVDGSEVGDQDSTAPTSYPSDGIYQGSTATSNTLADVAKYYYETDLRDDALWGNCAGGKSADDFPSGNPDVCTNNVFTSTTDSNTKQHMTTFTMGLGADGLLNFQTDYATANSGDFYDITHGIGSAKWPSPSANSQSAIDDLWHAAVNGRGEYFSAKDPDAIITGFNKALSSITAKVGSAAAAATSTLNPVPGNNFVYLASYTTVKWTGNLEARSINTSTASVSATASWCVENILKDTCAPPATIVSKTSGSSTIYNCVTTGATALSCTSPGVFDSVAKTCSTQIDNGCTGKLPPRVAGISSDTRTIYTAPAGGLTPLTGQNLVPFDSAYATANSTLFDATHVSSLSQWASPTVSAGHTAEKLINYLRGQSANEQRESNAVADRLYRTRETVMGDTLESQPSFIADPVFSYTYPGYAEYKAAQANRKGTVFVGSNDGMLHAFVAADDTDLIPDPKEVGGRERWAFVPSMVVTNMWKLADWTYSSKHINLVNGSPIISDVCVSNCTDAGTAVWKTILVGGLNGGGREYYALDITVPEKPVLLWEFTTNEASAIGSTKDSDLGYSFGRPNIARRADGTWVVVVSSGYNNISPGTGKGFLFVLKASDGTMLSKISTGVGDTTTPSGLAQVSIWNEASGGNVAGYSYGTDLLGHIWRFDINSAATADVGTGDVMEFARLYSDTAGTVPQPITTAPVLGLVNSSQRVVYVGTGKYLEALDSGTQQKQSLYAIKDVGSTATTVDNPRALTSSTPKMVEQTITTVSGTIFRTGSKNPVDFNTDLGWFIDFPDISTGLKPASERVNINPKLVLGTLLVPTIVPSSTVCSPGGYGWFNYFDYTNGWPVEGGVSNTNVSIRSDSPYVGFNIVYINGEARLLGVTANGDISEVGGGNCPGPNCKKVLFGSKSRLPVFREHRTIWRELIP